MRSLTAGRRDNAPSRWAYRFERLMLTPLFRLFLRVVVPFVVVAGAATIWLSDVDRRESLNLAVNDLRREIATRPEFMVSAMTVDGASQSISEDIRDILSLSFPASSFDLDLPAIRERVEELPAIASVAVRVRPGGILELNVAERTPVVVWRTHEGLTLVDPEGHVTGPAISRAAHAQMPLVAGEGAEHHVQEALRLFSAAAPLSDRVIGLVRVGERRWDLVLDRGQRIKLPEQGAVEALDRVVALSQAEELLERDIKVVDMRLAHRPTVQLTEQAVDAWWQASQSTTGTVGQ
ncbi:MAG: FtsQ-type POTRA domain-containing protein [Shimia sp.]|nr:FtsQ-type POTRA domain-containing protein [Shimia sp.]MCP4823659.1 FtsQ-type POTRA domain-containing protein [Shimia sp.]|mmetsp:Transcript_18268/g.28976  ORF Transcript_18268/g.28976 Transcript_18268/m.28976 type:complete len:293 (-) Transcript_18268:2417-3295(-)